MPAWQEGGLLLPVATLTVLMVALWASTSPSTHHPPPTSLTVQSSQIVSLSFSRPTTLAVTLNPSVCQTKANNYILYFHESLLWVIFCESTSCISSQSEEWRHEENIFLLVWLYWDGPSGRVSPEFPLRISNTSPQMFLSTSRLLMKAMLSACLSPACCVSLPCKGRYTSLWGPDALWEF